MIGRKIEQEQFFELLRLSMGVVEQTTFVATHEDWQCLHQEADRQSLTGVVYRAVAQLPTDQQPPLKLLLQWTCEAEGIKEMNERLNQESARLTKLFGEAGRRTAILKGPANARLYPDKFSRAPGDIDIWVEGGRESVLALLHTAPFVSMTGNHKLEPSYHHVHLLNKDKKVVIEVHFRPSSGNRNPFSNKRLQRWVEAEILNTERVEEGFHVPSVRFALVMQLSHIQRHFLSGGIGLRQVCDYFMLLKNSTAEDRQVVANRFGRFGLRNTAGALMWVLSEVLKLEPALMLCHPDSYRGEWMLREIMDGGNFGCYAVREQYSMWRRIFEDRQRRFRLMKFDFREALWCEIKFWKAVVKTLPERIRRRSFSLGEANKQDAKK